MVLQHRHIRNGNAGGQTTVTGVAGNCRLTAQYKRDGVAVIAARRIVTIEARPAEAAAAGAAAAAGDRCVRVC